MGNLDIRFQIYLGPQMFSLLCMIRADIYKRQTLDIILELLQFIQIIKSMEMFVLLKLDFFIIYLQKTF